MRRLGIALICSVLVIPFETSAAELHHETFDDGTVIILLAGDIESGDDDTFRELTIRYPNAILALDSDGGALIPALEIGRLVRLRNYTTVVLDDGTCVSSCALIWIAGARRLLSTSANLGFHASYVDDGGVKVESGVANALVGHYLSQLNLPQSAVIFATLAPPSEIAWLNTSNRALAGVDFESIQAEGRGVATPATGSISKARPTASVAPPPIQVIRVEPHRSSEHTDTASFIRDAFRAPGFAEAAARGLGARPNIEQPIADHLRRIYANDAIIERLAVEIDASGIDMTSNPGPAGTLLYRLSQQLTYRGLQRLPQRDVNRFFYYMSEAAARQDRSCTAFVDTGRASIGEFEAISQMGIPALREYLELLRRSMFAEVEDYPAIITLDAAQTEIAENAWSERLVEATADWNQDEFDALLAAMESFDALDAEGQCILTKFMVTEINAMQGISGDWFRRLYLAYISDGF